MVVPWYPLPLLSHSLHTIFPVLQFSPSSFLILLPAHPFTLIFYCSPVSHLLSPPPPIPIFFSLLVLATLHDVSPFLLPVLNHPSAFISFLPFSIICTFSSSHFPIFFHPSLTCLFPILSLALLCPAWSWELSCKLCNRVQHTVTARSFFLVLEACGQVYHRSCMVTHRVSSVRSVQGG